MPTRRQERLADAIIADAKNPKPANSGQLLANVGYAKNTAEAIPKKIINAKGVRDALRAKGFSEKAADDVVKEILHDKRIKPEVRLNAADKVYKRFGSYSPEKHDVRQLVVEISQEIAEKNGLNS